MRALARRTGNLKHRVEIRDHALTVDEPRDQGGDDAGPEPQELLAASLASCVAITIEMYAKRKGWDLGYVEVGCDFQAADRGCPTRFDLTLTLPDDLSDEQARKLEVIAAKCPVHRVLEGEVMFSEKVRRAPAGAAA